MYNNIEYNNLYEYNTFKNDTEINSIVSVTAFMDIGRGSWDKFQRNFENYFNAFKNYLFLNKKIIIFIDDKYLDIVSKFCNSDKIIVPININWLKENCKSWEKLEIAKNIMKSSNYIELVKSRINLKYPENIYPEYNAINHSKIDLIRYAINSNLITKNEMICWCDFGYYNSIFNNNPLEYPKFELDLNRLNVNKLNFFLRNKISNNDNDMFYTLIVAPEIFTGSFFAGNTKVMLELYDLYHESLDMLYTNNISDDDQHIYLRCFIKKPELFELFLSEDKWPQAIRYLEKKC
jgi:hypothetical protein